MKARIAEYYRYRELLASLVNLNLRARYHGTMLGMIWSLISPLLLLVIFIFVFKHIFNIPGNFGIRDFPLFVFLGFLPWIYLQGTVLMSSQCIIRNRSLIEKVWFPRAIIPIADVCSGLIHHVISFSVLAIALLFYGKNVNLLLAGTFVPVLILMQTVLISGLAMYLSCLNVYYRDTVHILEVALMVGFYMTPIFYDISMIPPYLHRFYLLNPMTGIILGYRSIFLNGTAPEMEYILSSAVLSLLIFAAGYLFFTACEKSFAEEI